MCLKALRIESLVLRFWPRLYHVGDVLKLLSSLQLVVSIVFHASCSQWQGSHRISPWLSPAVLRITLQLIIIIIVIISNTMFMVLSSCESSLFILWMLNGAKRPLTQDKPDDLGSDSTCTGCQNLHPPSPFIIITQLESWYSFYHPTECRRLSRPSWLVTYRDGLLVYRRSPILVLTGSDVAQLRWSRPTRYH